MSQVLLEGARTSVARVQGNLNSRAYCVRPLSFPVHICSLRIGWSVMDLLIGEKMLRCDNGVLVPSFEGHGTSFSTVLRVR